MEKAEEVDIRYKKIKKFLTFGFPGTGSIWEEWKKICLGFGADTPKLLLEVLKSEPEPLHYPAILALRVFGYEGGLNELEEQDFKIEYRLKPPDQNDILVVSPKYQLNMEDYPLCLENEENSLMWAAHFGASVLAKHLINRGIDVNAKNNKGETALCIAQFHHNLGHDRSEIIKLLLLVEAKK